MNRIRIVALSAFLLLLAAGALAGCSGDGTGSDSSGDSTSTGEGSGTATEIPVVEPTVQEPTTRSPESLSRAQRQLDAQCAQMDIQEAREMGIPPEEYGCDADGTGVPIREWLEQSR